MLKIFSYLVASFIITAIGGLCLYIAGGVFLMISGVDKSIMQGDNITMFIALLTAFAVLMGLFGYIKNEMLK